MNQSETVPNVSFPLGSFPHSRRHQNAVNGPMPLTSFLPFCLLGPEVCVDPARAAGLSSPAVIISQVSYWAADWLIGDGSFFPSLSFIGLFLSSFSSFLLCETSASPPGSFRHSLFPQPSPKLEQILSDWMKIESLELGVKPGLVPHNNVRASATLAAGRFITLCFLPFSL